MSIKPCVSGYMVSTVQGIDMARHWFPRKVREAFLESVKDGTIQRAPDPVTMIEGDISWYNSTGETQRLSVNLVRGPRTVIVQNPNTVLIHDAVSWATGKYAVADYPSVMQDAFGGRAQVDRQEVAADKLQFCRLFMDADSTQRTFQLGLLKPRESMHFRYVCSVQTPGTWTTASEFEPRNEAFARWARLVAYAEPAVAA